MKHETHSITVQFVEAIFSYGLVPLKTKPTHITAHSATLIDTIFTNNTNVLSKNDFIISDLSEHFPIYSAIATDHHSEKGRHHIILRDINEMRVIVKKSSPKNLSADCRYTVSQLSAGSIPTVNRQLTNSKPTLKNLTSVMTSQTLNPYRSIRISRMMYLGKFIYEIAL